MRAFLATAVLSLIASCASPPAGGAPVSLQDARSPADLAAVLESVASRSDAEACVARARIYSRLRQLDGARAPMLRAKGDAADVEVLSQPSSDDLKAESAGRVTRHFLERAREAPAAGSPWQGATSAPLRRFVLLGVASTFAELSDRDLRAEALEALAAASTELAEHDSVNPEIRREWQARAREASIRSSILRAAEDEGEAGAEARKFCESGIGRHLDEATRWADRGTAERAARGDPGRILESCLAALSHFGLARECLVSPTPAQEHALTAMEIVVRSLNDLMSRQP